MSAVLHIGLIVNPLAGLGGRPLLVDKNDTQLDIQLCGLRKITTGYDDHVLYRVSTM
jgi:hypothetical protein